MSFIKGRVDIISMGCSKNLVDSERLSRRLSAKGWTVNADPEEPAGEYVVVNTCGFIGDAKEESVNMILGLGELKKEGRIGNLVVMGCLSQRYMEQLPGEIPEVDSWYGKFDWNAFADKLQDLKKEQHEKPRDWDRDLTTPPYSAFVKISEGCNRLCAYCAIPLITGRHKSRPMEEIVDEVRELTGRGVKEFNIIAQDLSAYGTDIYHEKRLAQLVDAIADVPGVEWVRLHYAYPVDFPYDVLEVMRRRSNVCKYLDVALQHVSDTVLANMRRRIDSRGTREFIRRLREEVPGIRIRTTLMVGFPGEGDKEFEELLDFVNDIRFDRMGAFAYSEEEDTWAALNLADSIPEEEKQRRLDKLMAMQEDISLSLNEKLIGERVKVLVERHEGQWAVGRTQWDSPEVDPEIYVDFGNDALPEPGSFVNAMIARAEAYELYAEPVR